MLLLVATDREVVVIDVERGAASPTHGIGDRPTCLTPDPLVLSATAPIIDAALLAWWLASIG